MQLEKESPGEERGGGGKKRGRRKKKEEEKRREGRVAEVHEETTRWSAEPSSALRKPLVGNRKPEGFRGMLFHLVAIVALLTALVMAMWGTWQDRTTQRSHQTTRNARRRTLRRWRRKARRWCRALRGMAAGRRLLAGIWRVAANWTSVISAHHSENPRKKPTRARSRLIGGRRWKRARRKRRKQVRPTREQQAEKTWTAALQEAKERGRRDGENYGQRWGQARGEIRLLKGQRRSACCERNCVKVSCRLIRRLGMCYAAWLVWGAVDHSGTRRIGEARLPGPQGGGFDDPEGWSAEEEEGDEEWRRTHGSLKTRQEEHQEPPPEPPPEDEWMCEGGMPKGPEEHETEGKEQEGAASQEEG